MPELPDLEAYLAALGPRVRGRILAGVRLNNPFLLRTIAPPLGEAAGRTVTELRRLGKRVCLGLEGGRWLVIHLMIAGRLHWKKPAAKLATRRDLAAFDFADGSLTLTEAGTQRRASLHFVEDLAPLDPGGAEVMGISLAAFTHAITETNHTLKRALTDPRLFAGIGNAYSDEILHAARLSPVALTQKLTPGEIARLHEAVQTTLALWIERLRGAGFPENVTAFRPEMAAHGKYGQPCPACGSAIQRIRYAANETNYCPTCQTGGKLLADRALSRLLGKDWPRSLEELEDLKRR